ncbi:MAG TPA: efflux RND transporter permease subunit [Thermoanaerobaculia bacterium]|nr:efflux RND transporter permease subunit [Thermoanaerobaculia bacterium]
MTDAPKTAPGAASAPRRSFVTTRPVAVSMVFVSALVFGALSYERLPIALMPELSYPTLTVRTEYPGAAPEEVENDVSRRIEEAVGVVSGLRRMSSVSRAGVSDVVLELSWDTEMSDALQDTLEKLDLVFLPAQAERPLVLRFDPSLDPVLELGLAGDGERFAGDEGLRRLRRIAEQQVKRALEPIPGVAAVRVRGGLEEEIHVRLDAAQLRRTGLSEQSVIDRLRQENINVAGGTLEEGRTEYLVRTLNEYRDLEEIADTVVTSVEGREVRVRDLGQVLRANREREISTRTDGGESVQLDVYKEADANMVALADAVRLRVGELDLEAERERARAGAPATSEPGPRGGARGGVRATSAAAPLAQELYRNEGVALTVVADRSEFIEASIADVKGAALLGGALAVVVLFLFLRNLPSTLIVAVSIPISLLVTFAPMDLLGVSLNVMSLGGLALGIGMLVDSSIVVLESIFRCREEGDDLITAAVRGTSEVRSAVVASILTSIAVFLPMVFLEGVAGEAFGDLALAVVLSLLASLVVALGLVPMLASRGGWRRSQRATPSGAPRFAALRLLRDDFGRLREWARGGWWRWLVAALGVVGLALRFVVGSVFEGVGRLVALLVIGGALLAGRVLGPLAKRGFELLTRGPLRLAGAFLAALDRWYQPVLRSSLARPLPLLVVVAVVVATSVWALGRLDAELLPEVHQGEFTVDVALPVGTPLDETVRSLEPVERAILADRGRIARLLVTYGFDVQNTTRSDEGEHTARFKVVLDDPAPAVEQAEIARLRRLFEAVPGAGARITRPVLFSFKTPIEVEIVGDDLERLRRQSAAAEDLLRGLPELADVEATMRGGAPEVQVVYDRELLMRYGLELGEVAQRVRNQVQGFEATLYNLEDRRVPIIVRLAEDDRRDAEDLAGLVVNPGAPRPIRLGSVAQVELGEGPSEVRRVDARRVALLRANLGSASLGGAVEAIESALATELDWPSDLSYRIAGQNEEWQRSRASLWLALGLAVFLVYVIMAAQFESLVHPLVIMLTIPLAAVGALLTLSVFEVNLSIVVFLGLILLAGIVVNNAIVLVDYINTLRGRGMERTEAIVAAGRVRLRPILMTTATTVLGLLPMALGLGEGAEIRTPMSLAVIGGLLSSTALTLLVIPVVYALVDGLSERLLGRGTVVRESSEPSPRSSQAVVEGA